MINVNVTKKNGSKEVFDVEKIHKVIALAIDGIKDVSISDVEMNAGLSLYDGISTKEIHQLLIHSANNLISEAEPNYQYVAARLLLYWLRKDVWGYDNAPRLYEHIVNLTNKGIYDRQIVESYSESEIHKINKFIVHERDKLFTYSGLQQMVDKYLLKNRSTGEIHETPQFAYLIIAMVMFANYPKQDRLKYIKKCYDYFSTFKINLPTPIMCGVRTPIRQYSSCILLSVNDSLGSIFSNVSAVGYYTAKRAGIGLDVGRIRPIGSSIRSGEVSSTGVLPFLKVFESATKSTTQNGVRGGGGTVNFPFWHYEVESVIVLKNNSGTDETRIRKLDYVIQFSKIFYERVIADENITLFSPAECSDLYEAFGTEKFDEIYKKYEKDKKLIFRKVIPARQLIELFSRERLETGRIYMMNIDHCNSHSSFIETVRMTNLCCEIVQVTKPIEHIDDPNGEIGVCTLSALNLLEIKEDEYEEVCDIVVRVLDEILDCQDYPLPAAKNFAINRRSIGVGWTNLAGFLAKNKLGYEDSEAINVVDELAEKTQYYLLKASCNLAKEKGPCSKFNLTKYSQGLLPIDHYNKNVDTICKRKMSLDWEELRKDIRQNGLRHSTLTSIQPCESSSVIQNSTNGIEAVRALLSFKKSKQGILKQLVPNYSKYKDYYTLAFEMKSNIPYINIVATIQKWFDMSISANAYYNYSHFDENGIPLSQLIKDQLYMYKMGVKTLYYTNTPDESDYENLKNGCESGACSI